MNIAELRKRLTRDGEVTFTLRVRPGKRTTRWDDDAADETPVLSLAARAQENEANAALIRFLAKECGVPMANVTIVAGQRSRTKRVRITNL